MPGKAQINVRPAALPDAEALVDLNAAMAAETENRWLDSQRLREGTRAVFEFPDRGFYLVAEVGGKIVGTLLVTFEWSDWRNGTFWWIQSVYVRPEWRRKGVYTCMHRWVDSVARSRSDVCGIRLYVHRDNAGAQGTYSSLGMVRSHYHMFDTDFDA